MRNAIRKLTVLEGIEWVENVGEEKRQHKSSLHFIVGVKHTIFVENERQVRPICSIEQDGNNYLIYVGAGEIKSLWQEIPKSEKTIVEYFVE